MGLAIIIPDVDFSGANLGKVTLSESTDIMSLSIIGEDFVLGGANAATYDVQLNPSTTDQRDVVWSIEEGGTYASVDSSTGVLTILPGASAASVTVKATSSENNDVYATKTIIVSYGAFEDMLCSDGTAYINTGVKANVELNVDISFYYDGTASQRVFGAQDENGHVMQINSGEKGELFCWGYSYKYSEVINAPVNSSYNILFNSNNGEATITCNGEPISSDLLTKSTGAPNLYAYLFARNNKGTAQVIDANKAAIGVTKIYDSSMTLIRDFRPANINGVYCMLEMVSKTPYYPSSGSFSPKQ